MCDGLGLIFFLCAQKNAKNGSGEKEWEKASEWGKDAERGEKK